MVDSTNYNRTPTAIKKIENDTDDEDDDDDEDRSQLRADGIHLLYYLASILLDWVLLAFGWNEGSLKGKTNGKCYQQPGTRASRLRKPYGHVYDNCVLDPRLVG
jgi:hypothetical protein